MHLLGERGAPAGKGVRQQGGHLAPWPRRKKYTSTTAASSTSSTPSN